MIIFNFIFIIITITAGAAGDTTTTIDPTSNWGTWEGWGTSLAWWAKEYG
jgi:galactan endo-1,6-beta-galactosidase